MRTDSLPIAPDPSTPRPGQPTLEQTLEQALEQTHRTDHLRLPQTRLLIALSLAAASGLAPAADPPKGPVVSIDSTALARARAIAVGFDEGWAAGDLDLIMRDFSPDFGCKLYGGIDQHVLRKAFEHLLEQYPRSTCETRVLGIERHDPYIQVKVCRLLRDPVDGAPREELCHILYLAASSGAGDPAGCDDGPLQVYALEEHAHGGAAIIQDRAFKNPDCGLSFDIPPSMFAVNAPRVGMALEHVLLRSHDLDEEIHVVVLRNRAARSAKESLDQNLLRWTRAEPTARLELRTEFDIAGFPGYLAEYTYRGSGCSLRSSPSENRPRSATRVYVDVDAPYLLAIAMDRKATPDAPSSPLLDQLVSTLRLTPDPGKSYAATIDGRFGFGPVRGGHYEAGQAGLIIDDPGLSLDQCSRNGLYSITATEVGGTEPLVYIDAVPLQCAELTLDELVRMDNDRYLHASGDPDAVIIEEEAARIGGRTGLRVHRSTRGATRRHAETVVYVVHEGRQITLRIGGSTAEVASAQPLLTRVEEAVDLVPARQ